MYEDVNVVSEFISENYAWLIAVAVIIIMTIIGYIADKKDFGKKKEKKEKRKEKEPVVDSLEHNDDMESIDESIDYSNQSMDEYTDTPVDYENNSYDEDFELENIEELPILEENKEEQPVFDTVEPVEDVSLEQISESAPESTVEEFDSVEPVMPLDDFVMEEEDLASQFNEEVTSELPSDEFENNNESPSGLEMNEEITPVEPENFELPNIEQLDQEIADIQEDEDVWKF